MKINNFLNTKKVIFFMSNFYYGQSIFQIFFKTENITDNLINCVCTQVLFLTSCFSQRMGPEGSQDVKMGGNLIYLILLN